MNGAEFFEVLERKIEDDKNIDYNPVRNLLIGEAIDRRLQSNDDNTPNYLLFDYPLKIRSGEPFNFNITI